MSPPSTPLDPARTARLDLPPASHETAEFIWTANDAAAHDPQLQARVRGQDDKTEPHVFRAHFHLRTLPHDATLYLAGPRSATVFLNGKQILQAPDDGTRPKNLSVLWADAHSALRIGDNVLALEEVRGHSSLHTGASPTINQVTYGEVLAVKLVPASRAVDAPPLLVSNPQWRSTLHAPEGWQLPAFNDTAWPRVESLGVIGSKTDFLQWNADAGLYAWPGYTGITSALRVFPLAPARTTPLSEDSILLDFGREISSRVQLTSHADTLIEAQASYGESPEEALHDKSYLGTRTIAVPAHATVFGPKSAFRYVKLTAPADTLRKLDIRAQAITFSLDYTGSFESSDPELNRIWETAAYTARLCMQEGIWDAPKRDRGRWMGDLDVTARTIASAFASPAVNALLGQTMLDIVGEAPITRDVNTIAGYSALWITGEANVYRHTGNTASLRTLHDRLTSLLAVIDQGLDPHTGLFTNAAHRKVFVDWSDGFNADTPEARAATHLELTLAYREAAFLFTEMGDRTNADRARAQATRMQQAAQLQLANPQQTFGDRLQTNAMAIVSSTATDAQQQAIWQNVLSHINDTTQIVTPYYGYYVLAAMAATGHRTEALAWMRQYWGGMLAEGASSFWEAYDPHWPKQDFHAFLEADNKRGYYVSLAHGWSSGPAAWLQEEVLGIHPTTAGSREVSIRPDLAGLAFARGSVPTPRGPIHIDLTPQRLIITLPPDIQARVAVPYDSSAHVLFEGQPLPPTPTVNGRAQVTLTAPGTYTFSPH